MQKLRINGKVENVDVAPDTPLLWVLRDNLKLVGSKYGCGIGQCGACTVQLNDQAIRSCLFPVSAVGDGDITTIEGLTRGDDLHPLQQAWIDHDVPQCGYCQAGQLMSAAAFLATNPNPSEDDVAQAMSGNLCRCGCYKRINAAILSASAELANEIS